VNYKNFGTIPASNVRVKYDMLFDGHKAQRSNYNVYDSNSNLFPQVAHSIRLKTGADYENIIGVKTILDIIVNIKYQGITKDEFEVNERWRYDPNHNHFHHVGAHTN
jgi:hypothetical protein